MVLRISYLVLALLYFICCIWPSLEAPDGVLCPAVDGLSGCACKTENGVIDLSSLSSSTGDPRFTGMQDPNGFLYDFNPCKTFSSQGDCSDIYICQSSSFDGSVYAIADKGSEGIYISGSKTYIYYTGPGSREVQVELVCDKSAGDGYVQTIGDSELYLVYQFTLTSKYACPGSGGGGGGGGTAAGVVGIVLILLIIGGIATYFIVGGVLMRLRYEKTGSDLIINKIFWFALPGLIKEGFIFTFKPCFNGIRGLLNKNSGYKEEL